MNSKSSLAKSLCIAAMTVSMATAAHAAALRTFVSGFGSDSNTATNCSHAQPCRTFAMAVTVTSPGGEIEALDPAGYGPITIDRALSLIGLPGAAINAPSGGNGITINAGPKDAILVQGLLIDGVGVGANGVAFSAGGSLTISNCVVRNFPSGCCSIVGNGIFISPSSGTVIFAITDTTVSNNGGDGINYEPLSGASPTTKGIIDHVVATANGNFGISFETAGTSTPAVATLSNSVVSDNGTGIGVDNGSGTLKLSIDNVNVSGNSEGIVADHTANVLLGRSVITGNGTGINNATSPNTFFSYQNNQIDLNTSDIPTAMNTTKVLR
jgi:hypothetical protein